MAFWSTTLASSKKVDDDSTSEGATSVGTVASQPVQVNIFATPEFSQWSSVCHGAVGAAPRRDLFANPPAATASVFSNPAFQQWSQEIRTMSVDCLGD
jgi:hypothetical protein